MKTPPRLLAALLAALASLCATETKYWSQAGHADFDKGKLKGLSLSSDGRLTLAPASRELFDSASVYLWTLAEDSKGNLYAGGGGPGGPGAYLYVIPPHGKGRQIAQIDDLEVHAIAVDSKDRVYVATSPDGKVYRIGVKNKPEVFYDPKAKYIWGMAFNSNGDLFVATGDRGEVYRVTPDGKGSVFYKTSDTHARSLAIDAQSNLVLGTEPSGLIIRVNAKGEGFVLYQAPKREITAVAVAKDGTIYAAGVGNKQPGTTAPLSAPVVLPQRAAAAAIATPGQPAPATPVPAPPAPVAPVATGPPSIPGGSEVYRIDRDGFPHRAWANTQDVAYAIAFDPDNRPLVGTGNKGAIYRIDSDLVSTELLSEPPTQVTAILAGPKGRLYAATGNVGKVYEIGPDFEKQGTLESDVFDAAIFSRWGRLSFHGEANGGRIAFATRSGNLDRPDTDWSPWAGDISSPGGEIVSSPAARFVQWRATLAASSSGQSPAVSGVDLAYLPRNTAPVVKQIEITPANYRFAAPPVITAPTSQTLALPALGSTQPKTSLPLSADSASTSMQHARGYLGARWAASDENGDKLVYSIYIRGENETEWKLLKDDLTERQYSWDSTGFADGRYRVRVVASDRPDNPPDQALTAELVSEPFTIDNTPPEISGLIATPSGNKITVKWTARDALSTIDKAEYSINGGEWTVVDPITGLSDSREEQYTLTLDRPTPGEQTIAVRVADEFDNRAVGKVVVK